MMTKKYAILEYAAGGKFLEFIRCRERIYERWKMVC